MLSSFTQKLLVFFINYSSYIGVVPYRLIWDQNKYSIHYLKTLKYRIVQSLESLYRTVYLLFIYFRLVEQLLAHYNFPSELQLAITIQRIFYAVAYSIVMFYHYHQLLYGRELPQVLKCYLNFYKVTKSKPETQETEQIVDFINKENKRPIYFLLIMMSSLAIQNVIISLKRPWEKQLWTSLLDHPVEAPLSQKLVLYLGYGYFMCCACVSCQF